MIALCAHTCEYSHARDPHNARRCVICDSYRSHAWLSHACERYEFQFQKIHVRTPDITVRARVRVNASTRRASSYETHIAHTHASGMEIVSAEKVERNWSPNGKKIQTNLQRNSSAFFPANSILAGINSISLRNWRESEDKIIVNFQAILQRNFNLFTEKLKRN